MLLDGFPPIMILRLRAISMMLTCRDHSVHSNRRRDTIERAIKYSGVPSLRMNAGILVSNTQNTRVSLRFQNISAIYAAARFDAQYQQAHQYSLAECVRASYHRLLLTQTSVLSRPAGRIRPLSLSTILVLNSASGGARRGSLHPEGGLRRQP